MDKIQVTRSNGNRKIFRKSSPPRLKRFDSFLMSLVGMVSEQLGLVTLDISFFYYLMRSRTTNLSCLIRNTTQVYILYFWHALCLTFFCALYFHDHSEHDDKHKGVLPETRGTVEGSAKRNIVRKHNNDPNAKDKKQHGGGGGKGKWNELDDGSMP